MMSAIVDVSDCAFPLLYFLLYRLPAHSKSQRMTPRPCGLMARKTNDESHEVSERALEHGSGLGLHRGGVTGIEPALSAWEVCGAASRLPADWLTCGSADTLPVRDRDCPRRLLRSGTWRARAYLGEHLIRRSGRVIHDRSLRSTGWADIPGRSTRGSRCPPSWQQVWQQPLATGISEGTPPDGFQEHP
jgi:hypothetical protein